MGTAIVFIRRSLILPAQFDAQWRHPIPSIFRPFGAVATTHAPRRPFWKARNRLALLIVHGFGVLRVSDFKGSTLA